MALSDRLILQNIETGDIIIHRFNRRDLGTSSYDVRLGNYYFRENQKNNGIRDHIYNIYDQEHVKTVWGAPQIAVLAGDALLPQDMVNIDPYDRVIIVGPGESILCHTQEFIGGRHHITTMMKARSSMGRNFIEAVRCAGMGDVGYINRWTLEINNNSRFYSIPLVVGRRVGQIVFFETGPVLEKEYSYDGKYQNSASLEELIEAWRPENMLPKLYLDRDISKT